MYRAFLLVINIISNSIVFLTFYHIFNLFTSKIIVLPPINLIQAPNSPFPVSQMIFAFFKVKFPLVKKFSDACLNVIVLVFVDDLSIVSCSRLVEAAFSLVCSRQ